MDDTVRALRATLRSELDGLVMPDRLPALARRAGRQRFLAVVTGITALVLGGAGILWWTTAAREGGTPGQDVARPAASPQVTPGRGNFDGWEVDVHVSTERLGSLLVSAGPVRRAPANNANPWLEHDLIFSNAGRHPLHVDDTRTSVFLKSAGERRLLAADEGCGYALDSPNAVPKAGVCQRNLDAFDVPPYRSVTKEITLTKGLKGMGDLVAGTYSFRRPVVFRIGTVEEPVRTTIVIDYLVRPYSETSPAELVAVPDVIGMDLARAVTLLQGAGLAPDVSALPGAIRGYSGGNQTHPRVVVTRTAPAPGTEVAAGARVLILDTECPRRGGRRVC